MRIVLECDTEGLTLHSSRIHEPLLYLQTDWRFGDERELKRSTQRIWKAFPFILEGFFRYRLSESEEGEGGMVLRPQTIEYI
jgi:hypothetical protein